MPHRRPTDCLGGLVFIIGWSISSVAAGAVDPADITPVANLLGGLMAVAGARLLAALCAMLAALSLARGQGGLCLFLVMLAGIVLVAPVLIKTVVTHVAGTIGS